MDGNTKRELIIKTTLEMIQNVLPTNIVANLERMDACSEPSELLDDFEEDRFFYEQLTNKVQTIAPAEPIEDVSPVEFVELAKESNATDPLDTTASLTYFEIVEQEMMLSLPVTKENVSVFQQILSDFAEINSALLTYLKLQTVNQLTNLLIYALMTGEESEDTEQTLFLEPGTVNKTLEALCEVIVDKKDAFVHWPNRREISQNVQLFEVYHEFGNYKFYNVFGAIGTIELKLKPALPQYLCVNETQTTYTPVKWQCSCDSSMVLQSSVVFVPERENECKNSYVFETSAVKAKLGTLSAKGVYMVADETLGRFSFLLTPKEIIEVNADAHNKALESKRKIIDRTFQKIQSRFLVLDRIELRDVRHICNLIETVGILHNFLMVHNDQLYIGTD